MPTVSGPVFNESMVLLNDKTFETPIKKIHQNNRSWNLISSDNQAQSSNPEASPLSALYDASDRDLMTQLATKMEAVASVSSRFTSPRPDASTLGSPRSYVPPNSPADELLSSASASKISQTHVGLNDFNLVQVIGTGSFGKIMLARNKMSGQVFAIKMLLKSSITKKRQAMHTLSERQVLAEVNCPFIVKLHWAFQTEKKLYLVLDYLPGGELFYHLSRKRRFHVDRARFYAAELVLALEYLHTMGVTYRDLKPENILLDRQGHVRLVDFGLAKQNTTLTEGASSFCGTPEYLAPEVVKRQNYGGLIDWWSLGMVLFEMLTGLPPWYTKDRDALFRSILSAPLDFPDYIPEEAQSFISGLLTRDVSRRLGSDIAVVKEHVFFKGIDWEVLGRKGVEAPALPCKVTSADDAVENFEECFTRLPLDSESEEGAAAAAALAAAGGAAGPSKADLMRDPTSVLRRKKEEVHPKVQEMFVDYGYPAPRPVAVEKKSGSRRGGGLGAISLPPVMTEGGGGSETPGNGR